MVNGSDAEKPPPGAGVKTVMFAVPTLATSLAEIVARSVRTFATVVGRLTPFHWTFENASKPLPVTVSEKSADPAGIRAGDSAVATGAGFVTDVSVASASKILIRGFVTLPPERVSVTGKPVC